MPRARPVLIRSDPNGLRRQRRARVRTTDTQHVSSVLTALGERGPEQRARLPTPESKLHTPSGLTGAEYPSQRRGSRQPSGPATAGRMASWGVRGRTIVGSVIRCDDQTPEGGTRMNKTELSARVPAMHDAQTDYEPSVWKTLLRAAVPSLAIATGVVATTGAHANAEVIPVDVVLNTVKCEVAQFQARNSEYSRQPNARYVILGAEIRLVLRYVQGSRSNVGGGVTIGIPVLKAGSIIDGKISGTKDQVAIEEQVFVFDMNTSARDASICEDSDKLLSAQDGYSILQALENAKEALEAAAAGEPKIRIRSHQIKRHMALSRETEGDGGVTLFFLNVSGATGSNTSSSQELEVTFTLSEKTPKSVALAEPDWSSIIANGGQGSYVGSDSFDKILEQISNGVQSPGNIWILCNPMTAKDCDPTNWMAVSPCDVLPNLPTCPQRSDKLGGGRYFAEKEPLIVAPRERVEEELLKRFGWTLSQESIDSGAYSSLLERVERASGLLGQ